MERRKLLKALGSLGVSAAVGARPRRSLATDRGFDVLVVGAGVFGVWAAYHMHREGRRVAILDAVGPAHSGASSGGESRVTRCGYGDKEIYSEWAWRSLNDWQALSETTGLPIFNPLGVLWLHPENDELVLASAAVLARLGIPFSQLSSRELAARYPVMRVADGEAGLLEPRGGALMARRAVQLLAASLAADGVTMLGGKVKAVREAAGQRRVLPTVQTEDGRQIEAGQFVFACGPWLDRVCPDAVAGRLFATRQEVYYFSVPVGATGDLPVWADLPFYGFPSLEGRGFKVANDTHGPHMDPDTADRRASREGEEAARAFLARRFPGVAAAPLAETRVCQYENSSDGHLLIDRHPGLDNVWLVGCGSGHGFKHGPAAGAHVADLVAGRANPRAPFLLATKTVRQHRAVQ